MTKVSEIMTADVRVVAPEATLRDAAALMQRIDVGALPVCDGDRLLGMLTDRDITVRSTARGLDPGTTPVSAVMSDGVQWCSPDQEADHAMRQMGERQLRRLPVVDHGGRLVGIVSLGDLATRQNGHIDRTVREISEPRSASSAA